MYTDNKQINKYLSIWLGSMFMIVSLMIVVGGLTRLTDSGLSITQWQLFSGILPPLNVAEWNKYFNLYKEIPEYKLQNYSMTLEEFKVIFWWEFIHRFLGRLIGILYFFPLLFFFIKLSFFKTKELFFIFFLICLQGFIGWYMVSSGLVDRIDVSHYRLAIHLVLAFIIISLIFFNYLKYQNLRILEKRLNNFIPYSFILLIFLQIILGAFVSGMDAGKIYNSWPLMGLNYFPDDNLFIDLFKLSAFDEPSLVQFIHRNLAYFILFFYLFILSFVIIKDYFELKKIIFTIGFFLIIQIFLGILTILLGAHIYISSMHQVSSIFLVSSCVYLVFINSKIN
jgi:heme a synthase